MPRNTPERSVDPIDKRFLPEEMREPEPALELETPQQTAERLKKEEHKRAAKAEEGKVKKIDVERKLDEIKKYESPEEREDREQKERARDIIDKRMQSFVDSYKSTFSAEGLKRLGRTAIGLVGKKSKFDLYLGSLSLDNDDDLEKLKTEMVARMVKKDGKYKTLLVNGNGPGLDKEFAELVRESAEFLQPYDKK